VLLVVLVTLIRQNFIINQFPGSLVTKQQIIDQNISLNHALNKQNKTKMIELKAETASNMEILESQARYRFGLIKDGDIYYQINELAPNSVDNP
jgi:cell division protein FtsB